MQGSLYRNRYRWWWRVKLPGQNKYQHIPLKPIGAKFATKEKAVAIEVAKMIWQEVLQKQDQADVRTIADLTAAYYEHCKVYYQHSREASNIKYALDFLDDYTDVEYAQDFGAKDLKKIRERMGVLPKGGGTVLFLMSSFLFMHYNSRHKLIARRRLL